MSREFIDKLLLASRELDRIRSDNSQVLRIVFGLIRKDPDWKKRLALKASFPLDERRVLEMSHRSEKISVVFKRYCNESVTVLYKMDYDGTETYYSAEGTVATRAALPQFVTMLLEAFPLMESDAKPLLAALPS